MKTTSTPRRKPAARANLKATPRTNPTPRSKATPHAKATRTDATPRAKAAPDTVHRMQLRSGRNKPTTENENFHQQENGAYARPAIAVQSPYRHGLDSFRYIPNIEDAQDAQNNSSKVNGLGSPFKFKPKVSNHIAEDIFGGSLSSLSDFEEESSGDSLYFSFDEGSSGPTMGRSLSTAPNHRNFGLPLRHLSRTPVTPANSAAGPSRTVHDAPKKRKHPYNRRSSSWDDTPSKAGPSRPLERTSAAFMLPRGQPMLTDSDSSISSSFRDLLPPPTGLSSMDPDMIFLREYEALAQQTKRIKADRRRAHNMAETMSIERARVASSRQRYIEPN